MGTRNLSCAVVDGEFKLAQYGQWDGYPMGQGATTLQFLRTLILQNEVESFKTKLRALRVADDGDEAAVKRFSEGLGIKEGWMNAKQAEAFKDGFPFINRDTGAEIFNEVMQDRVPFVRLDLGFAGDSLFCEFAYVLDFDAEVLEVYKGFNAAGAEIAGRFKDTKTNPESEYAPITLWGTVPFDKAKDMTGEEFCKLFREDEEDEEDETTGGT